MFQQAGVYPEDSCLSIISPTGDKYVVKPVLRQSKDAEFLKIYEANNSTIITNLDAMPFEDHQLEESRPYSYNTEPPISSPANFTQLPGFSTLVKTFESNMTENEFVVFEVEMRNVEIQHLNLNSTSNSTVAATPFQFAHAKVNPQASWI